MHKFVEGLSSATKLFVLSHNPSSLMEAMKQAKLYDECKEENSDKVDVNYVKTKFPQGSRKKYEFKKKKQYSKEQKYDNNKYMKKSIKENRSCFKCKLATSPKIAEYVR